MELPKKYVQKKHTLTGEEKPLGWYFKFYGSYTPYLGHSGKSAFCVLRVCNGTYIEKSIFDKYPPVVNCLLNFTIAYTSIMQLARRVFVSSKQTQC